MKSYRKDLIFLGILLFSVVLGSVLLDFLAIPHRVHILIAVLSVIVFASIILLKWIGKGSVIGFFFLGTVLFKMFGVGYLALFEADFREYLFVYFGFFWYYLFLESLYLVQSVREQDKYHIKKNQG